MHYSKNKFSQNFLTDPVSIEKILAVLHPEKNESLLEIGPGRGALSIRILERGLPLSVVEIDKDLVVTLETLKKNFGQLTIYSEDILKFNLPKNHRWRIFGNLPYHISSPLLRHCLDQIEDIHDMHFMLQKEVVDRLVAQPNTKAYGRLSILAQYFCQVQKLFEVDKTCFEPQPQVTSAVLRLIPKPPEDRSVDPKKLAFVTQHAFGQRRKTLSNALKKLFNKAQLASLLIDPNRRAETLSLQEFCLLARELC